MEGIKHYMESGVQDWLFPDKVTISDTSAAGGRGWKHDRFTPETLPQHLYWSFIHNSSLYLPFSFYLL